MSYSFDGPNKLIVMDPGTTSFSVPQLWTDWVDWAALNPEYLLAMTSTGGNVIDPSTVTYVPKYVWLENGWQLRPQEASHTLSVLDGVLMVQGGGDPFVDTLGPYSVRINYQQPVTAVAVTAGATPQQVRDAMELTSTSGKPPVDDKLDNNLAMAIAGL